ncbi:hypothetical protein [Paenibacillus xylanexedens]|uniref:hypothetical protein n=1 Tax=Paenibacillus xylanexedens TaxID=528191 RepID=UPI0011A80C8F|nr:hypothetical protein [Paenibacillus xylanexedens]
MNEKYSMAYDDLVQTSHEILEYYDIDKIKPYSVYIWSKGDDGENVFDISDSGVIIYNRDHEIIEEAKPIISKIQHKLKEIVNLTS